MIFYGKPWSGVLYSSLWLDDVLNRVKHKLLDLGFGEHATHLQFGWDLYLFNACVDDDNFWSEAVVILSNTIRAYHDLLCLIYIR